MKKIVIANDHAGTELKFKLISFLQNKGFEVINLGTDTMDSVDYPTYVHPLAGFVESKKAEFGVLICGSAQGVAITANKHANIRAAVCWKKEIASLARQHNNANVLCLPARFLEENEAYEITQAFLATEFEGGRHQKRVDKISII
ncbi:ribose 5-phosphate isomerase B [Saccharicrinis sp. 156]|uniref:ribose 5-phosphate isomerase B n=1 Tax=Saccharicrinis sp. 156 TaxID=3417574 RepID=UPI003D3333F3